MITRSTHWRFIILAIVITALAGLLRGYHFWDQPHDLYVDEVAIGFNAHAVLTTGRDEYNVLLPLFFRSYGDYKLPVYVYLAVLTEALFGKTAFALRLPAVILGTATIPVFMLLLNELAVHRKQVLLAGLFLAISPWHLQFSRAGFEVTVALFLIVIGSWLVVRGLMTGRFLIWGLFCLLLSLYTYHTSRIFVPVMMVGILYLSKKPIRATFIAYWKKLLFLTVFLVPFILYSVSSSGLARLQTESLFRDLPQTEKNSVIKTSLWGAETYIINYLSYASINFHFFTGDTIGRHSVRELGEEYWWQLPLLIFGFWTFKKKPSRAGKLMLIWLLAAPIAAAFTTPNPHALRALYMVIPISYFSLLGSQIVFNVSGFKRNLLVIGIAVVVSYSVLGYLHIYYVHYAKRTDPDWQGGDKEMVEYIKSASGYQQIAITNNFPLRYMYLWYYGDIDPRLVQGSHETKSVGKFIFVGSPYTLPTDIKTLYVALPTDKSTGRPVKDIYDRGHNLIYRLWEN
jgi:hypothetical protein